MALTTTAQLKTYLNITNTSEDAFLNLLREGVEAEFLSLIQRNIEQAPYTDFLYGSGTNRVATVEYPVALSGVGITPPVVYEDSFGYWGTADDAFDPARDLLTVGTDYAWDSPDQVTSKSGVIYRINKPWPYSWTRQAQTLAPWVGRQPGAVKVVYTAGFNPVPADIQDAIFYTCAWRRKMRIGAFQTSQSYDGGSKGFELWKPFPSMLQLGDAATVVARYKRVAF